MDLRLDASTLIIGGAVAAVGLLVWRNWDSISTTWNPASRENGIYQGIGQVGSNVTGDPDWSLGTWFYEITHPYEEYESDPANAPLWWLMETGQYEYVNSDTIAGG